MTTVALIADQGRAGLQQVVRRGSVRHMAVSAVIIDGLVVVYKRATLLHMARIAGLDDAIPFHQFRACGTM